MKIENNSCYPNKEKTYKPFDYSCNIFPIIDSNEHSNTM